MNQLFTNISRRKVDETHLMINPFPGLRPFQIEESHLFFGREGQTDEVLMKLSENRFVAIIGPSGSGKSSFVYCGVLPTLYGGFLAHKGADWQVVVARPGASPVENLTEALLDAEPDYKNAQEEDKKIRYNITKSLLKSSSLGLVEAIQQIKSSGEKNYLILVDQFEELFRFRRVDETGRNLNESLAFVNLLMEAVQNAHVSVYVAITMRSDFIGDCAEYPELTKEINDSHYLIPQMTRDQKRMAIMGPVAVGGGQITPRLVQQLLNDLGEKSDQLPILQHALMRTWAYWREHREGQEPIDIHQYEAIGTMSEALSRHANEAYEELSYEHRRICEIMFKALTEKRGEGDGIRRPTKLREVAALAGVDDSEVIAIVEKFREPGRSLLTPPSHIRLAAESYVDISHESLMRIWERLKIWAEEEGESVRMYLRLAEASEMFQLGKAGLWRPPDLQIALNWQQKYNPSLTWAQRYHPAFERSMVFLEYSNKEWETEQKQKELQQKRALKRARITALVLGTAAIISIGFLIFAFIQMTIANKQTALAKEQTALATKNAVRADSAAREANRQSKIATEQKELAVTAGKIAEQRRIEAEIAKNDAIQQRAEAVTQKNNADIARVEAVNQKDAADKAKIAADKARENAERLRRISIAKQMAIKSQSLQDTLLEAVVAQQAYLFNAGNNGYEYDYDIYDGLYYAIKAISQGSFNSLKGHTGEVKDLVTSAKNNKMYSVGSDGFVFEWDISKDSPLPVLIVQNTYINRAVALNETTGELAVGGASPVVQIYNTRDLKSPPNNFQVPDNEIRFMKYNAFRDELIIVGATGGIYRYKNKEMSTLENGNIKIANLDASPVKNEILVGYANGDLAIIDLNNGNKNIFFQNPVNTDYTVVYSPDGKKLAVSGNSFIIRIWDTSNLKTQLINFSGHTGLIRELQFSHDGKQLASASFDRTVRLWNITDPSRQPVVLRDHNKYVWSEVYSQDDKYLYAGCTDGILRKWPTQSEMLSNVICGNSRVTRNMTQTEWNLYVQEDIPYQATCPNLSK